MHRDGSGGRQTLSELEAIARQKGVNLSNIGGTGKFEGAKGYGTTTETELSPGPQGRSIVYWKSSTEYPNLRKWTAVRQRRAGHLDADGTCPYFNRHRAGRLRRLVRSTNLSSTLFMYPTMALSSLTVRRSPARAPSGAAGQSRASSWARQRCASG